MLRVSSARRGGGGFLIFAPSPADAAAFKAAYAACQDKAVFKKAVTFPGDKDGKKAGEFLKGRIDAHECLLFTRGQQVSVDERDGDLWCVRRAGDLDCYWTIDKAVDLNPPLTSGGGAEAASPAGRRGGIRIPRKISAAISPLPPLPARGERERRAPVMRPGADRPPGVAPARGRARARGPAPPAPP